MSKGFNDSFPSDTLPSPLSALIRPGRKEIAQGPIPPRGVHGRSLPLGEVNHLEKTGCRTPTLGSGKGHTFASLSAESGRIWPLSQNKHNESAAPGSGLKVSRRKFRHLPACFALPDDDDDTCLKRVSLYGKARAILSLLEEDRGLKPIRGIPSSINCMNFRTSVRSCFADDLPVVDELSVKTSQKVVKAFCDNCDRHSAAALDKWTKERCLPRRVDEDHLRRFSSVLQRNVPRGWDDSARRYPYVPNGSASLYHRRREGGNWNQEGFSPKARVTQVISAGKPRVVTCYSSANVACLTPLHKSLFRALRKGRWLLVGPPTEDQVRMLNGEGPYVSVDYIGATDNINRQYVRAAVDVLIRKATSLDDTQIECLRSFAELPLEGQLSTSGQPMGSPMSFPLLCLINKTLVDLSLDDLIMQGKISFPEWFGHRCLINGDDLLLREPKSKELLFPRLKYHSACVGMVTNEEKTMRSSVYAEINSTVFESGSLMKKTNVKALYMEPGESDVLGYARRSTTNLASFRRVVRANAHILRRQPEAGFWALPRACQYTCRCDRKIRRALQFPIGQLKDPVRNFFNVEKRPEGYDLTPEEEAVIVNERVAFVRPKVLELFSQKRVKERTVPPVKRSWRELLQRPTREEDDNVLCVLARAWETKKKERLVEEEGGNLLRGERYDLSCFDGLSRRTPTISRIVEAIRGDRIAANLRTYRSTKTDRCPKLHAGEFIPLD